MYSNDEALDIKEEFKTEYEKEKDIEEIEKKLKKTFSSMIDDEDEAPSFWCILADIEWRYGVLTEKTKNKTLEILKNGGDVEFWRETSDEREAEKRKNVLKKLEEKLKTPQPPKRKIPKKRPYVCKWNVGDIFAYKLTQKDSENTEYYGKYVVFQVVDKYVNLDNHIMPHVHIYYKIFDKVPNINELQDIPFLIIGSTRINQELTYIYELGFYSLERSRSFKKENLHYIDNKEINKDIYIDIVKLEEEYNKLLSKEVFWHFFDSHIMHFFNCQKIYK